MLCMLLNDSILYYVPIYIIYMYIYIILLFSLLPRLLESAPISRNSTRDTTAPVPDPSASMVQLSLQQLLAATDRKLKVILLSYIYKKSIHFPSKNGNL